MLQHSMIYRTAAMLSSREGSAASRGSLKKTEFTPPHVAVEFSIHIL